MDARLILGIIAVVLLVLYAFGIGSESKVSLGWLGLAIWGFVVLVLRDLD